MDEETLKQLVKSSARVSDGRFGINYWPWGWLPSTRTEGANLTIDGRQRLHAAHAEQIPK
jgi:hypothetical protein